MTVLANIPPEFYGRLLLHVVFLFIIVRFLYYPVHRKRDLVFSYLMFGIATFFVTSLLSGIEFTLGFAFGLFAIFSVLRYRTETLTSKEMTYLFVVIAMSLLNAVSLLNLPELVLINGLLLVATWFSQSNLFMRQESRKTVQFENLELIRPERRAELIAELEGRTGLRIHRVEVRDIDFLRDSAMIRIYYAPEDAPTTTLVQP